MLRRVARGVFAASPDFDGANVASTVESGAPDGSLPVSIGLGWGWGGGEAVVERFLRWERREGMMQIRYVGDL